MFLILVNLIISVVQILFGASVLNFLFTKFGFTFSSVRLYTSFQYKEICESNGIIISMSRKGTPIDDSPMDPLWWTRKKEPIWDYSNL